MNSAGLSEAPVEKDLGCGRDIWVDRQVGLAVAAYAAANARSEAERRDDFWAFICERYQTNTDQQLVYQIPAFAYVTEEFRWVGRNVHAFATHNEANLIVAKKFLEDNDVMALRAIAKVTPPCKPARVGFAHGK